MDTLVTFEECLKIAFTAESMPATQPDNNLTVGDQYVILGALSIPQAYIMYARSKLVLKVQDMRKTNVHGDTFTPDKKQNLQYMINIIESLDQLFWKLIDDTYAPSGKYTHLSIVENWQVAGIPITKKDRETTLRKMMAVNLVLKKHSP